MLTDRTLQAISQARCFVDERPSPLAYIQRLGAIVGEASAIEASARMLAEALLELARPNKIDAERIDKGDWHRASGEGICGGRVIDREGTRGGCGHAYAEHPVVPGFEWLRRLCDGRLVKL